MNKKKKKKKILGKDNIDKIVNSRVLLVGIGGVGGSSLEMLVRLGINNITIVDFDKFEESNLNRQMLSLEDNIGIDKVEEAKKRVISINKNCNINIYNKKVDDEFINKLDSNYDYIIDACDDINAKVLLIEFAINNNIKIISCCGTGNRIDPSKLYITNIWKTEYDPLAKKLRYELRKKNIKYKLPVVSSKEIPIIKESGYVGSTPMVPNAAGILLVSDIVKDIIQK